MKNKLVKSMTMIIAIAMLISMVPAVVSATDFTSIEVTNVALSDDDLVTVTYNAAGAGELTLLALRDDKNFDDLMAGGSTLASLLPANTPAGDTELEGMIEYIDQYTINEAGDGKTLQFRLRQRTETNNDRYINVLLGGTDGITAANVGVYTAPAAAPESIAFVDDVVWLGATSGVENEKAEVSIEVTNAADDEWAGAVTSVKVGTTTFAKADADVTNDAITVELAKGTYTGIEVVATDYVTATNADDVVEVKSRVDETTVASTFGKEVNAETGAVTFTLPENDEDATDAAATTVEYTATKAVKADDGSLGTAEEVTVDGNRQFVIDRPTSSGQDDAINNAVVVTVVATVKYGDEVYATKTVGTYTVNEEGHDGYTITKDDITVSANAAAFGEEGSKVVTVKIPKDDIEPADQVVTINGIKMFYTPERSTGANHVFVAIVRENNDNAEAVAAVADIISEGATSIYYGKPSNPTSDAALTAADVARGLNMFKTGAYDGVTFSDEQYLTADVVGVAKIEAPAVARLLAAFKSEGSADKSGFDILAE